MNLTKQIGKRIPIILNREDIADAICQYLYKKDEELRDYFIDVIVPTEDIHGNIFLIAACTTETWRV